MGKIHYVLEHKKPLFSDLQKSILLDAYMRGSSLHDLIEFCFVNFGIRVKRGYSIGYNIGLYKKHISGSHTFCERLRTNVRRRVGSRILSSKYK